jgi:hypothetical protein
VKVVTGPGDGHFGPREGDDQGPYGYGASGLPIGPYASFPETAPIVDPPPTPTFEHSRRHQRTWPLALGGVGVVLALGASIWTVSTFGDLRLSLPILTSTRSTGSPDNGVTEVTNSQSGLTFRVPDGWVGQPTETTTTAGLPGITLRGMATKDRYNCEAHDYVRGWAGSVRINRRNSPEDVATDFAAAFTGTSYPKADRTGITTSAPRRLTIGDRIATRVDTTIRLAGDSCAADAGTLVTVVFDHPQGYQVFVAGGDTGGGRNPPPPLDPAELKSLVESLRG